MSSTVRNGFSTLNRFLGKKNKDTSMSKSVSNLSTLDTSSQHNKIIPLAASNNAPFEQTFRITICLPRDQLFVVRVGAKTKLRQLLDTVCANKQLDRDKYEFRHPDGSQTYDNEMTIGEVGLNEIRLADKNDKADIKFNTDDLMKLRHMSRESLTSSSDFSKGSNKQSIYSKTISPYSSTNSLNSMDSATGLNVNHHHHHHQHHLHHHNHNHNHNRFSHPNNNNHNNNNNNTSNRSQPPVAPQRKKRVAPRPPSQNSISEHQVVESSSDATSFKKPLPLALPRKAYHASTPNLNGTNEHKLTLINNNNNNNNNNVLNKNIAEAEKHRPNETATNVTIRNGSAAGDPRPSGVRPTTQIYATVKTNGGDDYTTRHSLASSMTQLNHSRTSSESSDLPTPMKRTFVASARKKAPPAPPPRLIVSSSPIPTTSPEPKVTTTANKEVIPQNCVVVSNSSTNPNISKVMLNVEPERVDEALQQSTSSSSSRVIEIDSRDLPSTTPSSPAPSSSVTTTEPRSLDSKCDSSDEDETKIYNIQTGKPTKLPESAPTKTQPKVATQSATIAEVSNAEFKVSSPVRMTVETPTSPVVINKSLTIIQNTSEPSSRAESPLWTYPLPAPPKFADSDMAKHNQPSPTAVTTTDRSEFYAGESLNGGGSSDTATIVSDLSDLSDIPIKPIIKERLPLNFHVFNDTSTIGDDVPSVTASDAEDGYQSFGQRFSREALLENLERRREQFIENEFKFLTTEDQETRVAQKGVGVGVKAEVVKRPQDDAINVVAKLTDKVAEVNQAIEITHNVSSIRNVVIDELKEVVAHPKLDVATKSNDQTIAGCDSTVLTNFSINTYANEKPTVVGTQSMGKLDSDDSDEMDYIINRVEPPTKNAVSPTTQEEDGTATPPNHFVKRPSLTNGGNLAPSRVNRSDSFHSTRTVEPSLEPSSTITTLNGLTPRSSSYISLIGTQKFENRSLHAHHQYADLTTTTLRRNSSSELSIADSPSLKSLSVMKSILSNSRKNSLNNNHNNNDVTSVVDVVELVNAQPVVLNRNTSITDINRPDQVSRVVESIHVEPINIVAQDVSVKATSNANVTITQLNTEAPPPPPTAKVAEKKWSYQGPPSISMSTWGERPKTAISIQKDKDYISNDAKPKTSTQVPVKNAISTISHHQPAATTKTAIVSQTSPLADHDRTPIIRGVVPKTTPTAQTPSSNGSPTAETTANISVRRPSYEISTYIVDKPAPETTIVTTSMTLGRVSIPNRWSTFGTSSTAASSGPASMSATNIAAASAVTTTVKAFKVADPVNNNHHISSTTLNAAAPATNNNSNYAIAKDGSFDSGYKSMPPVYSELRAAKQAQADAEPAAPVAAPFSQFTLRKTGLKDKILADPTARNVTKQPPPESSATATNTTTVVQLRSVNSNGQPSQRPFSVPTFVAPPPTLAKPKDGPTVVKASTAPPPPPPAAPVIRAVTTKRTLPPVQVDPRDQLMAAIRNFGQNGGLKKK